MESPFIFITYCIRTITRHLICNTWYYGLLFRLQGNYAALRHLHPKPLTQVPQPHPFFSPPMWGWSIGFRHFFYYYYVRINFCEIICEGVRLELTILDCELHDSTCAVVFQVFNFLQYNLQGSATRTHNLWIVSPPVSPAFYSSANRSYWSKTNNNLIM